MLHDIALAVVDIDDARAGCVRSNTKFRAAMNR
jgi:hypothetical protein